MKSYQWMTLVVVALVVVISPAWAKKGGNGGGGNGGGGEDPPVTPPTVGEVVFAGSLGTSEIKLDGSGEELAVPLETGDPSNLTFAAGARWYLVVRETETLPQFENGVQIGEVPVENIFAVHSITGAEMQLTDFAGDGLWIDGYSSIGPYTREVRWSRDGNDLEITCSAADEVDYLTVVDGELGYDFSTNYSLDCVFFTIPVSSQMLDAAYAADLPIIPYRRSDVTFLPHSTLGKWASRFTVSPDGLIGAYDEDSVGVRVFDTMTGEVVTLEEGGGGGWSSWTPDGRLLYSANGAIKLFDFDTWTSTVVTEQGDKDQFNLNMPQCSPDGQHVIYSARTHVKGNTYTSSWLTIKLDGTERTIVGDSIGVPLRWVED